VNLIDPFSLNTNPVFAELMPRSLDERRAAYADPAWRQRVRDAWAAGEGLPPRWGTYEVMESAANSESIGKRLTDVAADRESDPFDTLLDLAGEEPHLGALRVKTVLANDDPEGIAGLLNEPGCTLGLSDAGAHVGQLCDAPLPTDLLGNWVRERKVLTLEGAVHKLTQELAELVGFADRGVLRAGAFADVVVFDPETVGPGGLRRVRDFPADTERLTADQPTGMRHVLVNGVPTRVDEEQVELATLPGKVVAPSARSSS
jgi:N-acyl-D-amino-acid deacylase